MKNFMIGQFDHFDLSKLNKDYREGFFGIEACLLSSDEDIRALQKEAAKRNLNIGIHFPLRAGKYIPRDPLFLALDPEIRKQAYINIEEELNYIKAMNIKPQYILFHYPKPVIICDDFDLSRWRFCYRSEYTYESEYSFDELREHSEGLFGWLSEKSVEYDFVPVLELDAVNKYIAGSTFLEELLDKYSRVKLCIDVGRLHVQSSIDSAFSAIDILGRFIKYAEVVHLWNAKVGATLEHSHFPILPGLEPEEGWADVEAYFEIISSGSRNVKLLFEHRSDWVTDEELEACYNWIDSLNKKAME